jgi:hypothetical protein
MQPIVWIKTLSLAAAVMISGCSTKPSAQFGEHRGSLAAFVTAKIQEYGGQSRLRAAGLEGTWTAREEPLGILIQSGDIKFDEVKRVLEEAYGEGVAAGTTPENERQWAIPARKAGVAIWYAKWHQGVQINLTRPMTPETR